MPSPSFKEIVQDPRRKKAVRIRDQAERLIDQFFIQQDFERVKTPLLVRSPGMEPHIRPFTASALGRTEEKTFLPTSPEFAMKKLLAGGMKKIFQICPSFRSEPPSSTHHPEFTLLEWYRAHQNLDAILNDTQELVHHLAQSIQGRPQISFQGQTIDLSLPWPRYTCRDLFKMHVGIDLMGKDGKPIDLAPVCRKLGIETAENEPWDDLYFRLWLNYVEPKLPSDRPVFVERYPASQAALAVITADPDGTRWAKRFEFFIAGLELGNAFEELTDPKEQRHRFEKDMNFREQIYGKSFPKSPIDEEFLRALEEGLPPCAGIAVGVDRLIMLMADEPQIDYTFWLPSYAGGEAEG